MPGLFGYKMDTPNIMPHFLAKAYHGGVYWGGMGRDRAGPFLDTGGQGTPPPTVHAVYRRRKLRRHFGCPDRCLGHRAIVPAQDSVFTNTQCKYIWFWAAS